MVIVDEKAGRGLRDSILFVIGCVMIVALTGKWLIFGAAPDPALGGIALMLVGFGNMVLNRGGG